MTNTADWVSPWFNEPDQVAAMLAKYGVPHTYNVFASTLRTPCWVQKLIEACMDHYTCGPLSTACLWSVIGPKGPGEHAAIDAALRLGADPVAVVKAHTRGVWFTVAVWHHTASPKTCELVSRHRTMPAANKAARRLALKLRKKYGYCPPGPWPITVAYGWEGGYQQEFNPLITRKGR